MDRTNIFLRQIALLSFKLGGTMKDKHVENWLTSSKCFGLVTYHSSKWIINFIISANKESNWENKASIDYFRREN